MFHLRVLGAQAGNALGGIIWGNSIPIRRAAKDLRATRTAGAAIRALCDQRVVKCQANIPYPSRYLVHSRGMENAARGKQNIADPDFTSPTLDVDPFKKSVKMGRPLSPHFTIYQPQITWIGSILHRITGSGIAAGINQQTIPNFRQFFLMSSYSCIHRIMLIRRISFYPRGTSEFPKLYTASSNQFSESSGDGVLLLSLLQRNKTFGT